MSEKEITRGVVAYFKSDQWKELIRQLTQTEEELYHTHVYVENKVEAGSICRLFQRYFKRMGLPLDRKIDFVSPGPDILGAHSVHPHDPDRVLYIPHFDFFWKYNPNVVLQPSDSAKLGEEGSNIPTWGKKYMDNYYSKFDFKGVGPLEIRKIRQYFQSAHWKKGLRLVEDPAYAHVHINVEINFDPIILEAFALEALKEIGWRVDHIAPAVYHVPEGYQGKIVFLTAYPEEVWDICWGYVPNVAIRPAEKRFVGYFPEDGDIAYDAWTQKAVDELTTRDKYESLTDEQIEEILEQVL